MSGATNCPETPRQKMIGMMYLVLTAMLALNVSAAILNGYTQVDDSLHATIETMQESNADTYATFDAALAKNPEKTKEWYDKAMEVKQRSDEFFDYVQKFKDDMVFLVDGKKAKPNARVSELGKQDDTNVPQRYAIEEGNALILKNKINEYREFLIQITGDTKALDEELRRTFNTEDGQNAEGETISWEDMIFHEMPMCASITILTKLQNDIRHCEGEAVHSLLSATDASDLRVNKFNAYVIPSAKTVVQGSKFRANVILAAVDSTNTPEYYVNGQRLNDNGVYEIVANSVGVQKISGKIGYMDQQGEMQYLPFDTEYEVVAPTATISNTDLNIMYRGYDNPFSISVPGVSAHLLQVSCAHAEISNTGNGKWIISPLPSAPDNLSIEVFAVENGNRRVMGSQTYRVKTLPEPAIYFEMDGKLVKPMKIPYAKLRNKNNKFIPSYGEDGLIKVDFEIVAFKVNLPSGRGISVRGNKFNDEALKAVSGLREGSPLIINEIEAKDANGNLRKLDAFSIIL